MTLLAASTILSAMLVLYRAINVIYRMHWTTHHRGYAHFLGFGLSCAVLCAGMLLVILDATDGDVFLPCAVTTIAAAGMLIFNRRGPRR